MSQSYWQEQKIPVPAATNTKYDFIIVGGGIAGLSVAYWLQKENSNFKIAILEKATLGYGASGRNAGFVTCGSTEHFIKLQEQFGLEKAVEIWKFSEINRELLVEQIIQDQPQDVDYRSTGSCTVAPNLERFGLYQKTAKIMQQNGIDVVEVNAVAMEKDYGVKNFEGGIQYAGDGYVHPVKLLSRLYKKLKNVDVHENTDVSSFSEKNGVQILETSKGVFEAGKIILTLNAYLPLLHKKFEKLITPGRGQIILTKPLPHFVKGPCYLTKHLCYFRQLPTGELLVGGFRNLAVEQENTHVDATTEIIQNALFDFIRNYFTLGAHALIAKQWAGIMGFSSDGQMMMGALQHTPNVHLMAGCSGHGMGLSFNGARTLVHSLFGQKIPSHLDVNRF